MRHDLKECGKRIQQLRKERGLTQEQLAEKLNVSQNTIAKIESGLRRPSIDFLLEISEFFKVSTNYLVFGVYDLYACEVDGKKSIYCHFDNQDVEFFSIASTGTRSLALFYYWYIKMQKASFVFIDEFDAFYHFELSESVEKRLREIKGVQIFTTTHNTDLMSNDLLRPDCYFILKDNKIKAISELTEKELRLAHNLQKMYKAGAFNGR